ncbi:MAG: phage/plasmid primase, P4 family [Saccharofermentanales bacterium]|jgi:putative DNA primase/helicase
MRPFTLYLSATYGSIQNCYYPDKHTIVNEDDLLQAALFDHVSAEYRNSYRSTDHFLVADNVVLDLDNDHSDNPEDWMAFDDIKKAFPGVQLAMASSRNHMKAKGSISARPRFHVYLPIYEVTNPDEYKNLKEQIVSYFPYFDRNALDSARLIFGNRQAEVQLVDGDLLITDFLDESNFEAWDHDTTAIKEGNRNNTLSRFAGKIIKRYGNTEEAHALFMKKADLCHPPLDDVELQTIWNSAVSFGERIAAQKGYISPEKYNAANSLKPDDFSDVGQATVLAKTYGEILRFSEATDFLVYNGSFWEESQPNAQGLSQELTHRQLEESLQQMSNAMDQMMLSGAAQLLEDVSSKKAMEQFNPVQAKAYQQYEEALVYRKYAIKRRDSKYISAALREVKPMLQIKQEDLDKNEFLLNTPSLTINLKTGEQGEHQNSDYITKQTSLDPDDRGLELWLDALELFFQGDRGLIDYVQKIAGLCAIGKVYVEALIIAYGEGRNGKSTFWNVISRVLGTYSGNISADMLTVNCRRNVKPELAEAKGKRMLIAAEMEEGMRLNTSNVKQLCSTDPIYAEKKYKAPFSYTPTHTLILYTNHLPKVGALDEGTWRRLIVIPFEAVIEGAADVRNYADYLFEYAGGAVLSWIIDGAKKVIASNYKLLAPKRVHEAIKRYREGNDWLSSFLEECCEQDPSYSERSGDLYTEYRSYCIRMGEYTRSTTDFYTAIESSGFVRQRTSKGRLIFGLRLKSDFST